MKLDTSTAPELALLAAPATVTAAALVAGATLPGAAAPGTAVPQSGCPVPAASTEPRAAGPGATGTAGPADDDQPRGGAAPAGPAGPAGPVTVGYLAACLRFLVADPRRWWDLVRFDPQRPARIPVTAPAPGCETWLLVLPPGHDGEEPAHAPPGGVSCLVAGAVTEQVATPGGWQDRPLSPGRTRVRGGHDPSRLVNSGAGYAVTLHARAFPG